MNWAVLKMLFAAILSVAGGYAATPGDSQDSCGVRFFPSYLTL